MGDFTGDIDQQAADIALRAYMPNSEQLYMRLQSNCS